MEVTLFEEIYQLHRDLIAKDAVVWVEGLLRFDEFSDAWRLAARRVVDLNKLREQQARRLVLRWPVRADGNALVGRLADLLTPWRGGQCQVTIEYCGGGPSAALSLGAEWSIRPGRELLDQLESLVGRAGVRLLYGAAAGVGAGPSFGTGGH
jgi:DNA polymerase-3 subunit alpha